MKKMIDWPEKELSSKEAMQYLSEAQDLFDDAILPSSGMPLAIEDPVSFTDETGMIVFIVASELHNDEGIMNQIRDFQKILTDCMALVARKVLRISKDLDVKKRMDINLWKSVAAHLPLFSPDRIDKKTIHCNLRGFHIGEKLIEAILDNEIKNYESSKIKDFLNKQANQIKQGIAVGSEEFGTITLSATTKVSKIDDEIIFEPRIKMFQFNFNAENSDLLELSSYKDVSINVELLCASFLFDYKNFLRPNIAYQVRKFLDEKEKEPIADAKEFFSGDFQMEKRY